MPQHRTSMLAPDAMPRRLQASRPRRQSAFNTLGGKKRRGEDFPELFVLPPRAMTSSGHLSWSSRFGTANESRCGGGSLETALIWAWVRAAATDPLSLVTRKHGDTSSQGSLSSRSWFEASSLGCHPSPTEPALSNSARARFPAGGTSALYTHLVLIGTAQADA